MLNVLSTRKLKIEAENPTVLYFCKPWSRDWPPLPFDYCYPNNDCTINYGGTEENVRQADVIIFHPVFGCGMQNSEEWMVNMTEWRRPDQLFIFLQWESPEYHQGSYKYLDGFFNATMTYRSDSTFFTPYSNLALTKLTRYYSARYSQYNPMPIPIEKLTQQKLDDYYSNLPDENHELGVIAVISNCRSVYRSRAVRTLENLIRWPNGTKALDVYGRCAEKYQEEPGPGKNETFQKELGRDPRRVPQVVSKYKFYLAIENSRCKGYITEKFFDNALLAGSLGIVAGTVREDYEKLAPKDSFIHADDFGSLEELAERINFLLDPINKNDYKKYFDWKKRSSFDELEYSELDDFRDNYGFCKVCALAKRIHKGDRIEHRFESVQKWWFGSEKKFHHSSSMNEGVCVDNSRRRRRSVESVSDSFFDENDLQVEITKFL